MDLNVTKQTHYRLLNWTWMTIKHKRLLCHQKVEHIGSQMQLVASGKISVFFWYQSTNVILELTLSVDQELRTLSTYGTKQWRIMYSHASLCRFVIRPRITSPRSTLSESCSFPVDDVTAVVAACRSWSRRHADAAGNVRHTSIYADETIMTAY